MEGPLDLTTRYKVESRGGFRWQSSEECLLGVSVGQPAHEGQKFLATIEWASKRFAQIHVWIADTLHRHNLAYEIKAEPEEALRLSRQAGDAWLARNKPNLDAAGVPLSVSRWDSWLSDVRFSDALQHINDLYGAHAELRSVVDRDARKYLERALRHGRVIAAREFILAKSVTLILEECAVFCLLLADHPGVDIYPGSELETTRFLRTRRGMDVSSALANRRFARILFRRRNH